jgi:hypothetical protein
LFFEVTNLKVDGFAGAAPGITLSGKHFRPTFDEMIKENVTC